MKLEQTKAKLEQTEVKLEQTKAKLDSAILKMVKKNIFTIEEIAETFNVTVEYIEKLTALLR